MPSIIGHMLAPTTLHITEPTGEVLVAVGAVYLTDRIASDPTAVAMAGPMDFFSNDGRRLETLADWRDHVGPVSGHQWAEGRSARELARAWIEGDAATQVTSLLTSAPGLGGLVLYRGIAEKETRFDDIRGGPRHQDLLVIGRAASDTVVIGVEGKADEPFDEPLDRGSCAQKRVASGPVPLLVRGGSDGRAARTRLSIVQAATAALTVPEVVHRSR
jgi:hypothetical protein